MNHMKLPEEYIVHVQSLNQLMEVRQYYHKNYDKFDNEWYYYICTKDANLYNNFYKFKDSISNRYEHLPIYEYNDWKKLITKDLPKKWCIKGCRELGNYFMEIGVSCLSKNHNLNLLDSINRRGLRGNVSSFYYFTINNKWSHSETLLINYTEISFEEFKNLYMKENILPEEYIVECSNREETVEVTNYFKHENYEWAYFKYVYHSKKYVCDELLHDRILEEVKHLPIYSYKEWKELIDENKLPEKWCIKVTEENWDVLGSWRENGKCGVFSNEGKDIRGYCGMDGFWHPNFPYHCNYTEISFETFKKLVLKQDNMKTLPEEYIVECNNANETTEVANYFKKRNARDWGYNRYIYHSKKYSIENILHHNIDPYISTLPIYQYKEWKKLIAEDKLPRKWCVNPKNDNEYNMLCEWRIGICSGSYSTGAMCSDKFWISFPSKEYTEISFETFKNLVLKQNNMKELIGYKLKENCKQYEVSAIKIIDISLNKIYGLVDYENDIKKLKNAGVLDLWFEPVYEEEIINEKILFFGKIKFTITDGDDFAETKYGKVYKKEIEKAIRYIENPPAIADHVLSMHLNNNTYHNFNKLDNVNYNILGFGCEAGKLSELIAIYKAFE